ncbi:MAG: 2-oxoacid:ferredoxin oxidoreductase subunit beta [Syntrophomonadaceae bacterium]|nr:2-oxoacid:ferredoxin oxidoreductase subunit beta [Syntrophomonadaceae bacterium]
MDLQKYLRTERLPHIWCPGCGNGTVMLSFARAIEELKYDQDEVVVISGIGCSGRITGYMDFNSLHTTHGRALAFASGVKMANPRLKVFVFMGDGDCAAIGGNHFIHACRRNMDLNAIIINNGIYGMTGGQFSPLTPKGSKATTAPYGSIDRGFDIAALAQGAGATYVARAGTYHVNLLTRSIVRAAQNKGFSVVEAVSQCPVNYGSRNSFRTPAEMLLWQKENFVMVNRVKDMNPDDLQGKIVIGELYKAQEPEYAEEYDRLIENARRGEDMSA